MMIVGPGSIDSKDEEGYTKDETEQNTDSLYHFLFNPEKKPQTPTHVQLIKFGESYKYPRFHPFGFLESRSILIDERDYRMFPHQVPQK